MNTFSKSILIKADPESAFEAWTALENIPDYMKGVQEVQQEADDRSRWKMVAPDGAELEWVTQITRNEPPSRFAWSTVEGDVNTSGQVTFHQLDDGQTEITMMVNFGEEDQEPAAALAFPDPEEQVMQTLRDFKAMVEGR
ncbi:MAG: SRPBCC family protein [Anaerolineales bacterium]|nr:SRPBCC family protein [Anaerolineales bacterium]